VTIFLTSFKRYHEAQRGRGGLLDLSGGSMPGYSIAVYQPRGHSPLPKLDLFDIREGGKWVRPRDFLEGDVQPSGMTGVLEDTAVRGPDKELLHRYHDHLLSLYRRRWQQAQEGGQVGYEVAELLPLLSKDASVAFCCWCPYDRAAQRQLKDYGSFVCHSWVVESFLGAMGVEVVRDLDREKMVRS
jgi:rhodanese-related sulfurtransferase